MSGDNGTMLKKEIKLVITFYTTVDAMMMESLCKEKKMDGRLIPVPGAISAGCGLAWCAGMESEDVLRVFMEEQKITYQAVYSCLL